MYDLNQSVRVLVWLAVFFINGTVLQTVTHNVVSRPVVHYNDTDARIPTSIPVNIRAKLLWQEYWRKAVLLSTERL